MRNVSISQILIVIAIFVFLFTDFKKIKKELKKYQSKKEYPSEENDKSKKYKLK